MEGCLFCGVVAGDVPATVVYESERAIAFRDIGPQAPTHVLVIPREHYVDLPALLAGDPGLATELLLAADAVAAQEGLGTGFRLVVNTGPDGGQTVDHVHAHVLGGRHMTWPPG